MGAVRVRVVGGGIVGLTAALRLREAGHEVQLVTADPPERTTSAVAAAIWYPYRALPQAAVTRWAARTYEVLTGLADDPATGVRVRAGRELHTAPAPDPWWRDAVPHLVRTGPQGLPEGYVDAFELAVPVVDMAVHLAWLAAQVSAAGVRTTYRRLTALDDDEGVDAVVHSTGLGARELVGDQDLLAVRGQVVVVEQVGLERWLLVQGDERALTYVVPREHTVVLGGTAVEGDEDRAVRPATAQEVWERCTRLVPELARARVLDHRVGLRPVRSAVRLEREERPGRPPVVHCYGHGGAGVTLSYGCAEDVVALLG